jgi:OOP family OmpA-OmpF porin
MRYRERNQFMKVNDIKPVIVVFLVAGSLGAVSAHAEGLYAGASLGAPHYESGVNGIDGNGSGLGGKVFGGYQFTPNFALETGFAYLGHIDNATGKVNGRSEYLDAVGIAPLSDKWSLLGRIGVAHVDLNTSVADGGGNGLKLGAGAQYALTSNVALRGEWERYRPSIFGEKSNIDQYTVGVRIAF